MIRPATYLILLLSAIPGLSQDSISMLERKADSLHGLEKLEVLNQITEAAISQGSSKAFRHARTADLLADRLFKESDTDYPPDLLDALIRANLNLGLQYFDRTKYVSSRRELSTAQLLAEAAGVEGSFPELSVHVAKLDSLEAAGEFRENFLNKGLGNLGIGSGITQGVETLEGNRLVKQAERALEEGDQDLAVSKYREAIGVFKDLGEDATVLQLEIQISKLISESGDHETSAEFLDSVIQDRLPPIEEQVEVREQQEESRTKLKELSELYADERNYEKSLSYFKLYTALENQMREDSIAAVANRERLASEMQVLEQQREIAMLNVAVEQEARRQERIRLSLIGGILGLAALTALGFFFVKRRDHRKLSIAYRDLKSTKDKLQDAEDRIVKLLSQQVSPEIAEELITNVGEQPTERRFVCIMFLDIRDFTPMAEGMQPEELIEYQNKVFGFMIDIIHQHHGNVNQFLGDGFMATFGAPRSVGNDCDNALNAALEILQEIHERVLAKVIPTTRVGIGLHAGTVVTGNVGTDTRKQYSITGNTVIIASRVEQLTKQFQSQLIITEEVYEALTDKTLGRGKKEKTNVKGRVEPLSIFLVK